MKYSLKGRDKREISKKELSHDKKEKFLIRKKRLKVDKIIVYDIRGIFKNKSLGI